MSYILPVTGGAGGTSGGSSTCAPVVNVNQTNNCAPGDGTGGGGTGDTKDPSARVAIDGALNYAFDVASASKEGDGIYHVTTTPSFEMVGDEVQCAVEVTVEGELLDPLETPVTEFKGLASLTFDGSDIVLFIDQDLGEIYIIDSYHNTITGEDYDRLAIFNPFTRAWNYINFEGEVHDDVYLLKSIPLLYDSINKKAYVMLLDSVANHIGTTIFDVVGRQKVFNTWDIPGHGETQFHLILQINPNNNTCLIKGTNIKWYTTVDGIPTTLVDDITAWAGVDSPGLPPVVDINNNYWGYKNTGGSGQAWIRTFLSGSTITTEEISVSTDLVSNTPMRTEINPNTNCFYYLSGGHDYLIKFDCTAKTATRANAISYPTLTNPNRHLTLRSVTALAWSPDYTTIIAIRGGTGSSAEDILIVDPADGAILDGTEIEDKYSRNFDAGNMIVTQDQLFSVSSERLMMVDFIGGQNLETILTSKTIGSKYTWLEANKVQVEFRNNLTGARIDTPFSIAFHSEGTAAGGGDPGTGGGENEHQFVLPFAYGDATPSLIGEIAANKNILSVQVFITTAFNGSGATLQVGPVGTPGELMATTENAPGSTGEYSVYTAKSYGTATELFLTIVPGSGASAGAGVVVIEYQP